MTGIRPRLPQIAAGLLFSAMTLLAKPATPSLFAVPNETTAPLETPAEAAEDRYRLRGRLVDAPPGASAAVRSPTRSSRTLEGAAIRVNADGFALQPPEARSGSCLSCGEIIFSDDFESGNTAAWSETSP